ncbi:AAC(3) family N-acetyltransferase [bacterium]|nr:AAC(3) family N-acetyltransferase [bacterium]
MQKQLIKTLSQLVNETGLAEADAVLIHGDAIIAHAYVGPGVSKLEAVKHFLSDLLKALNPNTFVFFPSFTYKFTITGVFDLTESEGEVGLLSEVFMDHYSKTRTIDPIFSHCCNRNDVDLRSRVFTSAFGDKSFYNYILNRFINLKILNLGCSFERNTFCHHIEKHASVPYRFDKIFNGEILAEDDTLKIDYSYFCRDLDSSSASNFQKLRKELLADSNTHELHFNRIGFNVYDAHQFFEVGLNLLNVDKLSLLEEANDI